MKPAFSEQPRTFKLNGQSGVTAQSSHHAFAPPPSPTVRILLQRVIAGLTKSGPAFTDSERGRIIRIVEDIHALTDGIEAFPANTQYALRSPE